MEIGEAFCSNNIAMDEDLGDSQFPPSAPATVPTPPAPQSSTSSTKAVQFHSGTKIRTRTPSIRNGIPKFRGIPQFYENLYELVSDPSTDSIISWSKSNTSFIITNPEELVVSQILWKFCCYTFKEFLRRLTHFGFKECKSSANIWKFRNRNFVRGQPQRMLEMHKMAMHRSVKEVLEIRKMVNARAEKEVMSTLQNFRI